MDNTVESENDDVAKTFVLELIAAAKQLRQGEPMGEERNSANEEELQRLQNQYAEIQGNFQQSTPMLEEKNELAKRESK